MIRVLLSWVSKGHYEHKLKHALVDVESPFEIEIEILLIHFLKLENLQGFQVVLLVNIALFLLIEI